MDKEFKFDKEKEFSNWFSELVKKAELADLRYGVKGFVVFRYWSVLAMEKMYKYYEKTLQEKGHYPVWMPTVIPETYFSKEKEHVKGFTPEVFWVTEHGNGEKLEERLALRPTSETAFYQMYDLWVRSYKDLPLKRYQRAQVFRHETSATRPFMRSREFHWIETHCVFPNISQARKQVLEDMKTTKEVMWEVFGIPFIFFKRPIWDKFHGALESYAADSLTPSGKVIQQPSTHIISPKFSKAFNITYYDKNGKIKNATTTCYGPAISRIFASVMIVHGDEKGLKFPFEIAPKQVVIIPIFTSLKEKNKRIIKTVKGLQRKLSKNFDVISDLDEGKSPGEKFNEWEMKGVPIRLELGLRELDSKEYTLVRRDSRERIKVNEKDLKKKIKELGKEISNNLKEKAKILFDNSIVDVSSLDELKKVINNKKIARANFCAVNWDGEACSLRIREESLATVRGEKVGVKEQANGKCIVCNKEAKHIVYIAKQY